MVIFHSYVSLPEGTCESPQLASHPHFRSAQHGSTGAPKDENLPPKRLRAPLLVERTGFHREKNPSGKRHLDIPKISQNGSVSKPCTPGEHQNSW